MKSTTSTAPSAKPRARAAPAAWRPRANPWVIAVCVTLAAFMEVLDTTIVNVALPYIAGAVAVSNDQANYALTSYLVANGVVLTISGWISDTVGRKRYFLVCIAMFTVFSFLCGISQSLTQIIAFRALQGFFGGGLQPNQQSIMLDTFEPAKRGAAFAITAIATIVAPILGPTLGGFLTVNYGWRWIFFVNVPVGIFALVVNSLVVEDPPWEEEKRRRPRRGFDFVGLALIAVGLGCLQIMADRGEDDGWFGSPFIVVMALLAFLGIFGAICWLLTARHPIVNLEVFADRNFAMGFVLVGAMGIILYASSVLIPQFTQQNLGYDAYLSGLVLSPGGVAVILLIPVVGQAMKRIATRYIVMFGFAFMGCALYAASGLVPDIDFKTLVIMRSAQSAALGFLFVPISTIAYLTLPRRLQSAGAALFSMSRNVLGAIGISLSTAAVTERTQAEQAHLSQFMTPLHAGYNDLIQKSEAALQSLGNAASTLHQQAINHTYGTYKAQAQVLAYNDVFLYTAALAFAMVPLCLLVSNRKGTGGGAE